MPGPANFFLKRGDTLPVLGPVPLKDSNLETPTVDLPDDADVFFTMRNKLTHEVKVDFQPCSVDDANAWTVTYPWADEDVDEYGRFEGSFKVVYVDGRIESYPNNGYYIVDIEDDEDLG